MRGLVSRAARSRRLERSLKLFFLFAFLLILPQGVTAQTDSPWDGVWRGKWGGGAATSVTIKDGRVVEYYFRDRPHVITDSGASGESIVFSIPIFRYTLTRTNPNVATIEAKGARGESSTTTLTRVDEAWNGTWSGTWVGREGGAAAAITIADGRVTEYLFNRVPQPLDRQEVLPDRVSFGNSFYVIKMSRSGPNTADADYANTKGVTVTAKLAKGGADSAAGKASATSPSAKSATPAKSSSTGPAWCESDCRGLCAKTASGVGLTTESCIVKYSCSKYPAAPCAGTAAVNAQAAKIQSGSSKWYYEDCARRCDASTTSPVDRNSCYAQVCSQYPKRGR